MRLRPYQKEAIDAVLGEWQVGHKHTLLVLPTGTGKTICFSKIVEERVKQGGRVLILAHREELINQAADKLLEASGILASIEKAGLHTYGGAKVVIASVQTLSMQSRLEAFNPEYFSDIVVDEAHHSLSESYQKILLYFKNANVLGVTATPDRADHKSLGQFFDSKAYEYTLTKAINEKFLCKVKAQMIPLELDIKNVGISQGDYAIHDIGYALEPYLEQIAKEMCNYCKNRKTVVFLPLISTSQRFCGLLNDFGLNAVEVNGKSSDREIILRDFEEGRYQVLCNSMLLTEGWDCPSVDCVIVLRPTKVRSLYQQMVGRGMRLSPGKKDLLILDFLWMTERHDLCRPSSLISKDEDIAERINQKVKESAEEVDLLDLEEKAERDIIFERENTLMLELEAMKKKQRQLVDPIQYALSIAAEDLADYVPTFAWEMGPVTDKQKEYLERHGIFAESIENCGKASLMIEKLKSRQDEGLATPKQIRFLERYGFYHVGMWDFESASKMITRISINNWRLPRSINPETYSPEVGA